MILSLPLRYYLLQMEKISHAPVSLGKLLLPFGLGNQSGGDHHFLLVGYILDDLADQKNPEELVDPLDIASCAWELGYEPAKKFLEHGPYLMYKLLTESP